MAFNYFQNDTDNVVIGSGELYTCIFNKDKLVDQMDAGEMKCIGYIKDTAEIKAEFEKQGFYINSHQKIRQSLVNIKNVEFSTDIISFDMENTALFLAGIYENNIYKLTSKRTLPQLCLKFVSTDETAGKQIIINMYHAEWNGEFNFKFDNDNPVEFDYTFTLFNDVNGAYFSIEEKNI